LVVRTREGSPGRVLGLAPSSAWVNPHGPADPSALFMREEGEPRGKGILRWRTPLRKAGARSGTGAAAVGRMGQRAARRMTTAEELESIE